MIKQEIIDEIISFRSKRDWTQFHTIKDLCLGLNIEVSELQEFFLWKTKEQISETVVSKKDAISQEVADIFIFIAYLCHDLDIDLNEALRKKIHQNTLKYPVDKSRGNNKKYDEL